VLADTDALADVVWLCGEGADYVGLTGNGTAFAAIQQAFEDRISAFRRAHGTLEAAAGDPA
jgi:shikimate kinase